ncbi:MFS transporter [Fournierella sp.]|uniref:MFS transporter n=1 Tax=Allofournierella sp. TaxID=1940256 RepID=UPI003078C379
MQIKHQLRALYLLEAVSGFGLAQVIWVVLLAGRGFSLAQIGLAEGFFHLVSFLCEVPSGMAADLLGRRRTLALGWRLAYLTDFAAALAGLVLALGLTEPPRGQEASATLRDFWPRLRRHVADTGAFLRQNPAAVEKMLLDGACGCCAYFGGQLLQPRLMELGLPAGLLGPVLALLPLAGAAGSALAGRMGGRLRFRRVALLCAAGIGCSLALAGLPVLALALAAGAAATFWDGLLEVKMTALLNRDFPSDRRATLVSVQSMAYSLAMLPVSPLAGALCDELGYSGGMAALGLGLLSLVAAGMAAHRCRKRRRQE